MNGAIEAYKPINHIRIVTAASLFDGHDATINIMRRILQSSGAEVIHLGHNRSVAEIVDCAIAEDAQGIAITSYQGGHVEFFKYMFDLLKERNANIKLFGGGGGTILPSEIEELHDYGISRIYSPDDGRTLGLQGMINDLMKQCDFCTHTPPIDDALSKVKDRDPKVLASLISVAENFPDYRDELSEKIKSHWGHKKIPVLGITGTGGAGKSSLVDELVRRFLDDFDDKTIAIISVDPSKRKSGGALLGDRIRMNSIHHPRVFMRSLATRQSNLALSRYVQDSIDICKAAEFDLVIVETSGIGQSDTEITEHSDVSLYVMTAEYGAATQLEKIDMLDFADLIAINKFDKRGALDALRDVKKQYRRNHNLWETEDSALPVFGTMASQFNDPGMNTLYRKVMDSVSHKFDGVLQSSFTISDEMSSKKYVISPERVRYLAELCESADSYRDFINKQVAIARQLYQILGSVQAVRNIDHDPNQVLPQLDNLDDDPDYLVNLIDLYANLFGRLDYDCKQMLIAWPETVKKYTAEKFILRSVIRSSSRN